MARQVKLVAQFSTAINDCSNFAPLPKQCGENPPERGCAQEGRDENDSGILGCLFELDCRGSHGRSFQDHDLAAWPENGSFHDRARLAMVGLGFPHQKSRHGLPTGRQMMRLQEKSFDELHQLACAEAEDEGTVVVVANAM